ncbi:hypothetical protein OUZ56_011260 [Daphnia magna]|uniref:Uncharacterized protein n=1 Tax=Daphnia magna TaxID=35525 RepID=A0ABQ9YZN4_9CRUS|nr:hypothetical protein OUZ56_011260 [Daphnia magna]
MDICPALLSIFSKTTILDEAYIFRLVLLGERIRYVTALCGMTQCGKNVALPHSAPLGIHGVIALLDTKAPWTPRCNSTT